MLSDLPYQDDPVLIAASYVFVTVIGLVLGSFATAIAYRIPEGISWSVGGKGEAAAVSATRSACTHCKTPLGPRDLVPVFSWLASRGRCRHCGHAIGFSYPLTELAVLALCLAAFAVHGVSWLTLFMMVAAPFLVALLVIDLRHFILPNQLVLILAVLGCAYHAALFLSGHYTLTDAPVLVLEYAGGAFVYAGLVWGLGWLVSRTLRRDALGFGDVKFFAVAGLWLGLSQLPAFCLLSGMFGVVFAILWTVVKKERVFPFGPCIIAAFYVLLLLPSSFLG